MARQLYLDDNSIDELLAGLKLTLKSTKCFSKSIELKAETKKDDRKAVVYFSPVAWLKMTALVSSFDTEVEWHGLVSRRSDFEFDIEDIVVPPHEVGAATVTSDYSKYSEWINGLDDTTFNSLKFHGHSHVNMGVTPSGVDEKYRRDLVTTLPKATEYNDSFYIFLIINKKHEWSAEVFDVKNNAVYSTADIDIVSMLPDGSTLDDFVSDAKKVAVVPAPKSGTIYPIYNGVGASTYDSKYDYSKYSKSKEAKKTEKETKLITDEYDDYDGFGYYGYHGNWR